MVYAMDFFPKIWSTDAAEDIKNVMGYYYNRTPQEPGDAVKRDWLIGERLFIVRDELHSPLMFNSWLKEAETLLKNIDGPTRYELKQALKLYLRNPEGIEYDARQVAFL